MSTTPCICIHGLAVLASVIAAGCGDHLNEAGTAVAHEVRMDTVNGAVHVWNEGKGVWTDGQAWTVDEVLRLGARDSPKEMLFSGPLLTPATGPDGYIYVLDSEAELVTVFSPSGAFIRHIGGPGRGPGEFVGPSALAWDGFGRLWVADGFGGRYTVFSPDGELIRTQSRPVSALARRQHPLLYRRGGFLDEASRYPAVLFLKVDTAEAHVDTLGVLMRPAVSAAARAVRATPGSNFHRAAQGYKRALTWALAPDGTLWIADTSELLLVQLELGGDTLRVVHTSHRSSGLSPEEEEMIARGLSEVGLDRTDIDFVRPIVRKILVMDDGHLLVQIETNIDEDGSTFDVFDPDGRYLGPLDLGFAPASKGGTTFAGDTILAPTLGRLDVPYIVKAVLQRPPQHGSGE